MEQLESAHVYTEKKEEETAYFFINSACKFITTNVVIPVPDNYNICLKDFP
jgi:hypothetical protein